MPLKTNNQAEFFEKYKKNGKKWIYKGEVTAADTIDKETGETDIDINFDITNRHAGIPQMKPVDEEKLVELVKEIFKNKVFHDPIRKVKPTEIKKQEIEISGEQSKLSLADDILKAINNPEEHLRLKGDAHDEIRRDMKMLFDELDTLFHCSTIPIKPETEIKVLGKALTVDGIEEVGVAGLTVAPKEVVRESNINDMKGQTERSKLDRKRKKKVVGKYVENKKQKTQK